MRDKISQLPFGKSIIKITLTLFILLHSTVVHAQLTNEDAEYLKLNCPEYFAVAKPYIEKFRTDFPQRTTWTAGDIILELNGTLPDTEENRDFRRAAKLIESYEERRAELLRVRMIDSSKQSDRNLYFWSKPPIVMSIGLETLETDGSRALHLYVSNTSERPIFNIELSTILAGELKRAMIFPNIQGGSTEKIKFITLKSYFGIQPLDFKADLIEGIYLRATCEGFKGAFDWQIKFPRQP